VTKPPMTTVASGRWTSAPVPVASAMGTNPREATRAVMSTGRRRVSAPWIIASLSSTPSRRSWLGSFEGLQTLAQRAGLRPPGFHTLGGAAGKRGDEHNDNSHQGFDRHDRFSNVGAVAWQASGAQRMIAVAQTSNGKRLSTGHRQPWVRCRAPRSGGRSGGSSWEEKGKRESRGQEAREMPAR
jgi:hypothetical protein